MRRIGGMEVYLHAFLNSALDGDEWSASSSSRFIRRERVPWHPLDRRLDGQQNRSGVGGEEKNSKPLPGIEPLIIQPVVQRYTTELSHNKVM
jgi:hypothetical protein